MSKCYINGIGCVSAQNTTVDYDFKNYQELIEDVVFAHKPNYKAYIKPTLIRRMSSGVKMGVVASSIALEQANLEIPGSIITGSGMGCVRDSDKFLKNIINNDEQFLTPTSFIQSTHNTVGAQIALGLECKAYNVTYVHGATSFESSLIDAQLMLDENVENVLVGGVDELGEYTTNLYKLIGHVKEPSSIGLKSKGAIFSEGAQFFVLMNQKTNQSYAQLVDVAIYNHLDDSEIEARLIQFLGNNNLSISDIDTVVLGKNDDLEYDYIYKNLQESILKNTQQLRYKHLSGEYNTVSSFGLWMACHIIKEQEIPEILKLNKQEKTPLRNILLYNQYRGGNHSFTLLGSC